MAIKKRATKKRATKKSAVRKSARKRSAVRKIKSKGSGRTWTEVTVYSIVIKGRSHHES